MGQVGGPLRQAKARGPWPSGPGDQREPLTNAAEAKPPLRLRIAEVDILSRITL